jgi:aminoglycoside phosphotransferase (APT) family kinase protein
MTRSTGTPPAEVRITEDLVRGLLAQQRAELAALPLRREGEGWDNVTYRLGEDLAVRLPKRKSAVPWLRKEQRWLPELAPRLPVPIPAPNYSGEPDLGFPFPWSVVPWFSGERLGLGGLAEHQAERFGQFLRALHRFTPSPGLPKNETRGVPITERLGPISERMDRLRAASEPTLNEGVLQAWDSAMNAENDFAPVTIHGDFHHGNVIQNNGVVSSVLDWGDYCQGDLATDLACLWSLCEATPSRRRLLDAYGEVSRVTLTVARGWAVLFAVVLVETGLQDNPHSAGVGRRILQRVSESVRADELRDLG